MFVIKMQRWILSLAFVAGVVGCASGPVVQEFPSTANSAEEVQRFTADMNTALKQQVDVLSPNAFGKAKEALQAALNDQKSGRDTTDILHSVAVGRAQLARAEQFAALSRSNLEGVVVARQAALDANAPKLFSEGFQKADEKLRSVTEEIEDNDLDDVAENREKLQTIYRDLELMAIQETNLGPARITIAAAVQEGAAEHAKQSLAIAEKSVNDTNAFIIANRHDTEGVKSRSEKALLDAKHLVKITRASKAGKNITSEEAALLLEREQKKTQQGRNQLAEEKQTTSDLTSETETLKVDQAFNESFEAARAAFSSSEAEVYRKGNHLVIRLRALEFPVNQSVLRGSNFPLLGKVVKVIKGFENPSVVVEGHTDSDGGKELNNKLSMERSEAVSDYIVASGVIQRGKVSFVGHGFERPLTSNKTAQGKAQNRRVDIIISPEKTVQ